MAEKWITTKALYSETSNVLGVVVETIYPGSLGKVQLQGTYWQARCTRDVELPQDAQVCVVGREDATLLVEPMQVETVLDAAIVKTKIFVSSDFQGAPRLFIQKFKRLDPPPHISHEYEWLIADFEFSETERISVKDEWLIADYSETKLISAQRYGDPFVDDVTQLVDGVTQDIQSHAAAETLTSIASDLDKIDAQIEEYQVLASQLREDTRKGLSELEGVIRQL